MQPRLFLALVIAACGPRPPDDGATTGETSGAATTTGPGTTTSPPTTGAATTTGSSTGATDDSSSAASVDPTGLKFDLPPERDEGPPPQPPACDPPPEVPPEGHCELLEHMGWGFMYDCLEGADPDACPDAASETVRLLINSCSVCMGVSGEAMCGPDPRRGDACCYWGFDVADRCPL